MENNLYYTITRNISGKELGEIFDIRTENFYSNGFDEAYWNGGIQILLNAGQILNTHNEDKSSKFLLLKNNENRIVAYSRFSVNSKIIDNYLISKIHIIAVSKSLAGQIFFIDNEKSKVGVFMINQIINDCQQHNSDLIISEICVFPFPNLPSLIIHKKYDFIPVSNFLKSVNRDNTVSNSFIILGKFIINKPRHLFTNESI